MIRDTAGNVDSDIITTSPMTVENETSSGTDVGVWSRAEQVPIDGSYKKAEMIPFTFTVICHPGKTHNHRSRGDTPWKAQTKR